MQTSRPGKQTLSTQVERLSTPPAVDRAYFTVPIKRVEEPRPADPPAVTRRNGARLLVAAVAVAALTAAAAAAWVRVQLPGAPAAVAEQPVVTVLVAELVAEEAPAVLPAIAEAPVAPVAETLAEIEPAAGAATLPHREVIRQRPGAVLAAEQAMIPEIRTADRAEPPAIPLVEAAVETPAVDHLIQRGDDLLSTGDITSARLLYERAATTGDPQAMMALAQTYDPAVLRKLGARGIRPEPTLAQHWYAKAAERHAQVAVTAQQ